MNKEHENEQSATCVNTQAPFVEFEKASMVIYSTESEFRENSIEFKPFDSLPKWKEQKDWREKRGDIYFHITFHNSFIAAEIKFIDPSDYDYFEVITPTLMYSENFDNTEQGLKLAKQWLNKIKRELATQLAETE